MRYCLLLFGAELLLAQGPLVEIAKPSEQGPGMSRRGDELKMRDMTLRQLIQYSWSLHEQQLVAGPDWAANTRYDITATVAGETRPELRRILAEHFRLELRDEKVEMLAYTMAAAPGGHKLSKATDGSSPRMDVNQANGSGTIKARRVPMKRLTDWLIEALDRPILDETGAQGDFDFEVSWQDGRSGLTTALESSLGLKLATKNAVMTTYRIVRAERP